MQSLIGVNDSIHSIAGDVFIPQIINGLLQILTLVVLSTVMSAIITPWILIAVLPVVIVFYLMKKISNVSIRQLKRLENIARSPLLSHVNATSQGLPTIVAYGQQDRFFETYETILAGCCLNRSYNKIFQVCLNKCTELLE